MRRDDSTCGHTRQDPRTEIRIMRRQVPHEADLVCGARAAAAQYERELRIKGRPGPARDQRLRPSRQWARA